jgi:hypothetical protein
MCKDECITEGVSPLITGLKPDYTMNDRVSTARKASCYVRGVGADGNSDPTCAHHAITNIFEEARKAMDGVLKAMMNITEELATLDVGKIKIFGRTWAGSRLPSAL